MNRWSLLALPFVFACSSPVSPFDDGGLADSGAIDAAGVDTGTFHFVDGGSDASTAKPDGGSCDPSDMLVILDRSDSMSTNVGTQGSRISLAIAAINAITQPPTDTTLRFGLQTLPQIGGVECSTALVVPMGLGSSGAIASALGGMSPQLDYGTPIGAALASAQATLAKSKVANRPQYVLLITDGGECCSCGTNTADIALAQQLQAAGIQTFVVGFGGDDDPVLLNNLACAGHTATNFATDCTCTGTACAVSASVNSATTPLYFKASDGTSLKKALATITNQTCCDCNVPN